MGVSVGGGIGMAGVGEGSSVAVVSSIEEGIGFRLGISRPLAVVSTVSAIPVIASPVSSIAVAVVTISGLGRHHSEEGDGESDLRERCE